ncbi:sulfurtransferase TusA family protein [Marinimicrobium sp. C6131]|uniref:sulfurtransferase TusA family protein n=1 Tax=Marinimicrobium sp. C6131 TaxID=3022676 RepID=UPI00223CCDF9|nr:sulfurtransferase TusA family protein [Marinimicrobium sp. C6131]UZJ45828.1 sulfurtransferase TusA family protein [Marinimicrobium sp. C6131]
MTGRDDLPPIVMEVDAQGLRCPLPLLKAKQALRDVAPGEAVRVLATDGGSVRDFQTFAALAGHRLEREESPDGLYIYILVKS